MVSSFLKRHPPSPDPIVKLCHFGAKLPKFLTSGERRSPETALEKLTIFTFSSTIKGTLADLGPLIPLVPKAFPLHSPVAK